MTLVFLNRRRETEPVRLGPAVTWPRTKEQTLRVQAALDKAKSVGNSDLADFYAYQLANKAARENNLNDPGSAA